MNARSETVQLLNSIDMVQQRLALGKTKVFELIKTGKLQSVKIGKKTLVTETSINAFLASLVAIDQKEAA